MNVCTCGRISHSRENASATNAGSSVISEAGSSGDAEVIAATGSLKSDDKKEEKAGENTSRQNASILHSVAAALGACTQRISRREFAIRVCKST